ncbi:FtsX-like permease family protein [bacterium]|nr:FtsX-like permease family protein [bacterium]
MAWFGRIIPILAKRFLLSKTTDGFLSFISLVSIFGVALGVMALTLVTSVINGFEGELSRVITGMNGDVLLYTRGELFQSPNQVISQIRDHLPQVTAVSPSFVTEIMASHDQLVAGAVLQGVEQESIGEVTQIPRRVIQGRLAQEFGEIAIGASLAERLGVSLNSSVRLMIPYSGGDIQSSPKLMDAKVVGIIKMGMYEYDSKFIYAPLDFVQKFLEQPGRVTTFHISLQAGSSARDASDQLTHLFGYPFRAKDWTQLNRNLFYAIALEKVVIAIILTVIVVVAAFNVVSTLMMMIHDKGKEMAILKAMGLRPSQSFGLFCWIGLGIGLVGIVLGVVSGLALGQLLEYTQLIRIPADVYYIGFLPVVFVWSEVGYIIIVALLISFLATLYPAWQIMRKSPLEGLRYE